MDDGHSACLQYIAAVDGSVNGDSGAAVFRVILEYLLYLFIDRGL